NVRDALAVPADKRSPEQTQALVDYQIAEDAPSRKMNEEVAQLRTRLAARAEMKARVLAERTAERRVSHVLHRGDFLQPEGEVSPGTLAALPPLGTRGAAPDRLDLAGWLVAKDNPLVPRVTVNHLWSDLFGRGLVKTPGDFGVRGE